MDSFGVGGVLAQCTGVARRYSPSPHHPQRRNLQRIQILPDRARDEPRGDRGAVVVQDRHQAHRVDAAFVDDEAAQLGVAVLLHQKYEIVLGDEILDGPGGTVIRVLEHADFRVFGCKGVYDGGGLVARAIVDHDDFGIPAALMYAGEDGLKSASDADGLVIGGDDD